MFTLWPIISLGISCGFLLVGISSLWINSSATKGNMFIGNSWIWGFLVYAVFYQRNIQEITFIVPLLWLAQALGTILYIVTFFLPTKLPPQGKQLEDECKSLLFFPMCAFIILTVSFPSIENGPRFSMLFSLLPSVVAVFLLFTTWRKLNTIQIDYCNEKDVMKKVFKPFRFMLASIIVMIFIQLLILTLHFLLYIPLETLFVIPFTMTCGLFFNLTLIPFWLLWKRESHDKKLGSSSNAQLEPSPSSSGKLHDNLMFKKQTGIVPSEILILM